MITRTCAAGTARTSRRTVLVAVPLAVLATVGCAPQNNEDASSDTAAGRQLLRIPAADRDPAPDVRG